MKLYTDKGNYQSIKLLLASFVTGETIEVHYVGENERPDVLQKGKLPVLEYEPDKHLVSANAACRYILAKKNEDYQDPEVDQLIDWEADTLQPLVHAALVQQLGAAGKMDDVILQQLHAALTTLNEKLVKKYFLVAKRLTAADIAIFATIYPLFSKLTPLPAEKNKHDAICTWYGKLMEVPPFVKAAKEVFPGDDKQLLKDYVCSTKE